MIYLKKQSILVVIIILFTTFLSRKTFSQPKDYYLNTSQNNNTKNLSYSTKNTTDLGINYEDIIEKSEPENLNKELWILNSFILLVGVTQWDWFTGGFEFKNEKYFGKTTKYGGTDKIGHFYSAYLIDDLFTRTLIKRGWKRKRASLYSGTATFLSTLMIEIGDGTSKDHGFSYEDQVMNTLGVLVSYFLINNPSLNEKIDLRIEYIPAANSFTSGGNLLDDYERMAYFIALKLGGFNKLKTTLLRFFELQTAYKARGYQNDRPNKNRYLSFGIGLDIGQILDKITGNRTNPYAKGTFEYYQIPYTYIHYEKDLNK
ncbi:DUF2279 domain-containing protein [Pseudomonadota bacterium]